jgi:hypothetical protein
MGVSSSCMHATLYDFGLPLKKKEKRHACSLFKIKSSHDLISLIEQGAKVPS